MMKKKPDVLALNRSFIPIHILRWDKALKNMVKGSVRSLDRDLVAYDFEDWLAFSDLLSEEYPFVRTVDRKICIPEIIVEKDFNKIPMRDVKYSRQSIFERDKFCCGYCGKHFQRSELTIDHIIPKSKGGRSVWKNTVASCKPCNSKKSDRTLEEAGMRLRAKPHKPKWVSPLAKIGPSHPCKSWARFMDRTLVDIGE